MRTVLASGVFDVLHPGHLFFLQEAKKLGDRLEVIVSHDQTVERDKGFTPIFNQEQRCEIIGSLKVVDRAHVGKLKQHEKLVQQIQPDVIVLGYDQNYGIKSLLEKLDFVPEVVRLEHYPEEPIASSKIKEKIVYELRRSDQLS